MTHKKTKEFSKECPRASLEADRTCPRCRGVGYTAKESQEVVKEENGKFKTYSLGSGCSLCLGLGYLKGKL